VGAVKLTGIEVAVELSGRYTTMFTGQLIVGAVVSTTFTVRETEVAALPESSAAE
jgi:hypothetical protein